MTRARRIQAIRARCLVRRWEYRQRNLAHGAWARFREALALASHAYVVDDTTAAALVAEGFPTDDRGARLEPPRHIIWITPDRAAQLQSAEALALHLDARLLEVPTLILVAFADG